MLVRAICAEGTLLTYIFYIFFRKNTPAEKNDWRELGELAEFCRDFSGGKREKCAGGGKSVQDRTQNPENLGEILTTLTAPLKEKVKLHEIQGICTRYGEVDNTRWSCALSHRQRCFSLLYHRAHRARTVCAPHIFFPLLLLSVRTCFRSGYC